MKKRRTLIISLLLIAALALGIGYAGFTSELVISGDAVLNSTTTSGVVIKEVKTIGLATDSDIKVTTQGVGTRTAQVDITGFATTQDSVIIEVVIENPHEFEILLTPPAITEKNNTIKDTDLKYFNFELVPGQALPTSIEKAYYKDGELVKPTVKFQYKVSVANVTADAHTVSYTITTDASTRATAQVTPEDTTQGQ